MATIEEIRFDPAYPPSHCEFGTKRPAFAPMSTESIMVILLCRHLSFQQQLKTGFTSRAYSWARSISDAESRTIAAYMDAYYDRCEACWFDLKRRGTCQVCDGWQYIERACCSDCAAPIGYAGSTLSTSPFHPFMVREDKVLCSNCWFDKRLEYQVLYGEMIEKHKDGRVRARWTEPYCL